MPSDAVEARGTHRNMHGLELYESDSLLCESVAEYLALGLTGRGAVVAIVAAEHRAPLIEALRGHPVDVEGAAAAGRITLLDARETLATFMSGDLPDRALFFARVGAVIDRAAAAGGGQVRAYGEMVDLLWSDGNRAAAAQLEELWNELARTRSFDLLCAYGGSFQKSGDELGMRRVYAAHDHVSHAVSTERHFRLLVESVTDYAIFMLDTGGRIISWNPGAERMKGYRADEIIGQHFSRFYPEEEARSGKCERELETALREGRFEEEGWRLRKDGSRFWANVVITRVRDGQGRHVGFSKVTRDLTERKKATERLIREQSALAFERAAREHAERVSRVGELFMGMLGHDLRNPLTAIVAGSQYIARVSDDERVTRATARISASAARMSRMIDQLLDVTRLRLAGGFILSPVEVDLAALARQLIEETEAAHQRAIALAVRGDPVGRWDADRIGQLFSNLLANAAVHGEAGAPIEVTVDGESADEVALEVVNRGRIPESILPHVFEPFRGRAEPRGEHGLGLGLYITWEIARAHRGTIAVVSSGDHTRFRVLLPRA